MPQSSSDTNLNLLLDDLLGGRAEMIRVFKSGPGSKVLAAIELLSRGVSPVLVARDAAELAEVRALLRLLSPPRENRPFDRRWCVFPAFPPKERGHGDWPKRMACLYGLLEADSPKGVVLTPENLLPAWPARSVLAANTLTLNQGEDMSPELIMEQAVTWGYERVSMITRPGEMAMRGDILDIFAPGFDNPLRLEFFGDTLEDMRLFDPMSQRSRISLSQAVILPVSPAVFSSELREKAEARIAGLEKEGVIPRAMARKNLDAVGAGLGVVLPDLYYENSALLLDWLPGNGVFLLPGETDLKTALDEGLWTWNAHVREEYADHEDEEFGYRPPGKSEDALKSLGRSRRLIFEDLVWGVQTGDDQQGVDLPERAIGSFEELFAPKAGEEGRSIARDRPWQTLVAALKEWSVKRGRTVLSFHSERSRKKFLSLAEQEGIKARNRFEPDRTGLFALVSPFQKGVDAAWADTLILGEDVLQPSGRARPPVADKSFVGLKAYDDLAQDDLLVHRDYGLGRFGGLERMDIGGVGNDFLILLYSGEDKLYLPVDRLSLVQRYKGAEDAPPALDRLGGVGWVRTREKARKAIEKIARDLVEMYAYRRIAKGFSYGPVTELYREFEVSFGFEETADQARAIQDVLQDMEKEEPMDRLVCGDVGFGKTEVAMRAAFRAAVEGRQVALLCPTTVLAEQHYQNFRSRFKDFPLNVAMLSRFVPPRKQKDVAKACSQGLVDILIGTHRLLSSDVTFPNLGLLVLDEEQRFGVKHKERLKQFRKNVDVLTLTATPIPRTLQLSLSGLRGLSVIETPPRERKPVITNLVERDDELLAKVLKRELDREGQVFWVHNRVRGLARVGEYVRKLAPEARIAMAHGQMPERELEETMHKFWHGELDILVCTSIIESGLDFPRANTLVVDQAHMFGLGQLYQLRGRVGRSERQAYACFVTPDPDRLGNVAMKRLKIIMDMDFLGAGYQVALEDLRLRGAGNILGESQSGQIAKVGLDLFLEMLEEEVNRLRGEPVSEATDPELHIGFAAHIPESYIPESGERLSFYKSFSSARDEETIRDLVAEVRDRFGHLPDELTDFLAVLELKRLLGELQVVKADVLPAKLRLTFQDKAMVVSPEHLVQWVAQRGGRARLAPPATLELLLDEKGAIRTRLEGAISELSELKTGPSGPSNTTAP